ncbi:PREDICTED: uncharacterized protein LOC104779198 [Camelina sativa]|uniref:Uncharacterized protein LOC104779198 n=1 Tax=Camelina sativa TaxID=90675 RepID=A0ABM0YJD9_CAMSA|nr:PREDICTED: uncharacterized protein LOC104779198 [Camelina sativa]
MEVVDSSDQLISTKLLNGEEVINIIVVYAAPTVSRRSGLWAQLREVMCGVVGSLLVGGDFNTIVRLDERSGGNGRLSQDSVTFGDWINKSPLIDMGFKGKQFTWRRGREERTLVAKRLDRVLCCPATRLRWQEAKVTHLPFLSSNHVPLYVQLSPETVMDPRWRPFRFEAAWMKHECFKDLLLASWRRDLSTPDALKQLEVTLCRWNREVFGVVQRRK